MTAQTAISAKLCWRRMGLSTPADGRHGRRCAICPRPRGMRVVGPRAPRAARPLMRPTAGLRPRRGGDGDCCKLTESVPGLGQVELPHQRHDVLRAPATSVAARFACACVGNETAWNALHVSPRGRRLAAATHHHPRVQDAPALEAVLGGAGLVPVAHLERVVLAHGPSCASRTHEANRLIAQGGAPQPCSSLDLMPLAALAARSLGLEAPRSCEARALALRLLPASSSSKPGPHLRRPTRSAGPAPCSAPRAPAAPRHPASPAAARRRPQRARRRRSPAPGAPAPPPARRTARGARRSGG